LLRPGTSSYLGKKAKAEGLEVNLKIIAKAGTSIALNKKQKVKGLDISLQTTVNVGDVILSR
jgi:hypothetical protein